jgi:transposase
VKGKEGEESKAEAFRHPKFAETQEFCAMIKGTLLEQSQIVLQSNSYMTDYIFYVWARDCFIPALGDRQFWSVFVLDNFGAHITPRVLRLFRDNRIHVVGLPPHSSEILQPLDLLTNQSLKKALSTVWSGHIALNPKLRDNKFKVQDLLQLLCCKQVIELPTVDIRREWSVLEIALDPSTCKRAFELSGLHMSGAHQYRESDLRSLFDDDGLLLPSARSTAVMTCLRFVQ